MDTVVCPRSVYSVHEIAPIARFMLACATEIIVEMLVSRDSFIADLYCDMI